MQEWQDRTARSPHEALILSEFVPALVGIVEDLAEPPSGSPTERLAGLDARVRALEQLQARAAALVRGPNIDIGSFAPQLAALPASAELPVPGAGHGAPKSDWSPICSCFEAGWLFVHSTMLVQLALITPASLVGILEQRPRCVRCFAFEERL